MTKENKKDPKSLMDPLTASGYILFDQDFDSDTVKPAIIKIKMLNLLPKDKQPKRILIDINSPGGIIWSLNHLLQTMKESKIPVDTHTSGLAASCGCLLLMHGQRRTATKYADIMSHQFSWGAEGKEHELMGKQKAIKLGSKRMIDMYKKTTGKSEKYIRQHLLGPTDVWLTASEAKKHGIIDAIK